MNQMSRLEAASVDAAQPWWRGAAIYQVYPRSFQDSNGDGIGDLAGITQRLDYIASLGMDAVWIAPFFTSPMLDFGYDVADFEDVDPIFGTLADFDRLIARAHQLGLKVIIDQVYSHASDQHPWFVESRSSRDNPKADWFVWADPKPDGTPPNNWQSIFSGPAWTWDARRGQYYFHNFLREQPDLNLHNPEVQDALLAAGRFWLERGVDGFRIDAVSHMMHDPALTDNPASTDPNRLRARGHDFQDNIHNQAHPAIFGFLERLRALTDEYGSVFTVAEVGGAGMGEFTKACTAEGKRLNSAYGFEFLYASALTPQLVAHALELWPDRPELGWPSWAFENHDAPRAISRWWRADQRDAALRLKAALFASLRGNIIYYQGEELGLDQVEIPFEQLRDPEAIANWPLTLSRDGARTPMPWVTQSESGGFTEGKPWLPVGTDNLARAVDRQEGDPASPLNLTRELLALRRAHPALRAGACTVALADDQRLVLRRQTGADRVLCLFNFGAMATDWPAGFSANGRVLAAVNGAQPGHLPAFGAILIEESE